MAISAITKHILVLIHEVDMLMDLKLDRILNVVCGFCFSWRSFINWYIENLIK